MKKYFHIIIVLFMGVIINSCLNVNNSVEPSSSKLIESNLQATIDSVVANTHVPGVVAGIWAPNIGLNFVYTAGVADLDTKASLSPDMVFRIGSNTKTFTITVLLQLVDEGLLSLNDKLSKYFPNFPRANEITIEMLANMRSGIFNYNLADEFINKMLSNPTRTWSADSLIAIAALHPFYFNPGTGFRYSNTNTIIAGRIIEKLTGVSLEYNIRTRIINKLNLINTVYLVGGTQIPGYHSNGYYFGEYDPANPSSLEYTDISWAGAAGAMISTIYELKTYVKALTEGKFLSSTLQQKRMSRFESNILNWKYGIGIWEDKGFYGHAGSIFGCTSLMVHSPDKNATIIIWYNSQIEGTTPAYLFREIVKSVYPEL